MPILLIATGVLLIFLALTGKFETVWGLIVNPVSASSTPQP